MNVVHVQMMNQQDLIETFPLLWNSISWIYIYTKHGSHINTFKKDKINDSRKFLALECFLNWKIVYMEKKLNWKIASIKEN
jgi:hypothetical protein